MCATQSTETFLHSAIIRMWLPWLRTGNLWLHTNSTALNHHIGWRKWIKCHKRAKRERSVHCYRMNGRERWVPVRNQWRTVGWFDPHTTLPLQYHVNSSAYLRVCNNSKTTTYYRCQVLFVLKSYAAVICVLWTAVITLAQRNHRHGLGCNSNYRQPASARWCCKSSINASYI